MAIPNRHAAPPARFRAKWPSLAMVVALAFSCASTSALAQSTLTRVVLKSGQTLDGTILQQRSDGSVRMALLDGTTREVAASDIASIARPSLAKSTPAPGPAPLPAPTTAKPVPTPAAAEETAIDTVFLVDGGRVRGTVMVESKTAGVRIKLLDGTVKEVPANNVKLVEYGVPVAQAPPASPVSPAPAPSAFAVEPESSTPSEPRNQRSKPGAVGSFQGQFGVGAYIPIDEDRDSVQSHGAFVEVTPGLQGTIGYFVTRVVALGAGFILQPSLAVGDDGVGFALQGYITFNADFYFAKGAGAVMNTLVGFGGPAAFGVYGGYGPVAGVGFEYVLAPGATMHPTLGAEALTSLATRSGEIKGGFVELQFTFGFVAF